MYQFKGSVPTPFMNADGDKATAGTSSKINSSIVTVAQHSSAGRDSVSIVGSFTTAPTNEGSFMTAESQSTGRPPPASLTRQGQQKSLSSSSATTSENTHSSDLLSPDSVTTTSSMPLLPDASPTDTKNEGLGTHISVPQRRER